MQFLTLQSLQLWARIALPADHLDRTTCWPPGSHYPLNTDRTACWTPGLHHRIAPPAEPSIYHLILKAYHFCKCLKPPHLPHETDGWSNIDHIEHRLHQTSNTEHRSHRTSNTEHRLHWISNTSNIDYIEHRTSNIDWTEPDRTNPTVRTKPTTDNQSTTDAPL
jgi:hypothetical protein